MVDSGDPFHSTFDEDTKPAPVTVRVKAFPSSIMEFGINVMDESETGSTVNTTGGELAPPGFPTVMSTVPGNAIKLAGTEAVNCVGLT